MGVIALLGSCFFSEKKMPSKRWMCCRVGLVGSLGSGSGSLSGKIGNLFQAEWGSALPRGWQRVSGCICLCFVLKCQKIIHSTSI